MSGGATLNGEPCSHANLTIPGVGLWSAVVSLADAVAFSGAVTLSLLDTEWHGFVVAGAVVDGGARYRIVAGRGGWGKDIPSRAYANDAGLLTAALVADAATAAGEPTPVGFAGRQGPHFDRRQGPASFALNLLAPRAWRSDAAGVVNAGAWPAQPASLLGILRRDPAQRVVELEVVSSFAGLTPGTATEFGAAADVELEVSKDGARAMLYAAPAAPRRARALARLMAAIDPSAPWRGVYEYRVVSQSGERLNLQPIRSRAALPDLARVPVRAGMAGLKAQHTPGSAVLVSFLDGDPTRPAVTGFDAPDSPGWLPLELDADGLTALTLGGAGALGVARITDAVQAGPFAGVITFGSLRVKAAL